MKIALYSDLHNECGTPWVPPASAEEADLVILAGDISEHARGLIWASNAFPATPVVYVAGNHEYYGAHLGLLDELRRLSRLLGIRFLERDTAIFENHGVRILGCTLWSGFSLHGYGAQQVLAMATARRSINDYRLISTRGGRCLDPKDTETLHRNSVAWLDRELSLPFNGKTVVVTHFAPHPDCVAPQHQDSELSPYFVSDLAWLMEKHRVALWCHGHTHTNCDFVAENGCRVVSNQLGYPGERSHAHGGIFFDTGFNNRLLIEV